MKFMKRFIVFWKQDIINKLIVLISLLVTTSIIVFLYLIYNMPQGKSLMGAFSEILPFSSTSTPDTKLFFTNTPEPTITTMAFNIPETPTLSGNNIPPKFIPLSPAPTTADVISTPMPTLSFALSTPALGLFTSTPMLGTTPITSISNECIPNNPTQTGKVVDIIDGNTIKVLINNLVYVVRYIGVTAPEDRIYGQTATLENSRLVFAKEITLITDVSDKDPRGRLLRYVKVGDIFVNLDLIQKGLGSAVDASPDSSCAQVFKEAEQVAVNSRLGKWSVAPTAKVTP